MGVKTADQNLVTVKDPSGQLGTIARSDLPAALRAQYTVPDDSEIQAQNDKQEFGTGLGNATKALLEEGASTATFGISRHLENMSGITTPEAQAAREKYNPGSSALGTVAGVAADPLDAIGLVGKVGGKVTEGAAKLIGKAAPEASLASKILRSAPAAGLGSAVEGAAFGLGQSVKESALGDPDAMGEKLLSNVGYGSLLGGGLGAALTAGELAVPAIVEKAKDSASNITARLLGNPDEVGPLGKAFAKASSFVSGKPEESILEGLRGRQALLENPEAKEKLAQEFADTLQEHVDKLSEASRKANTDIRPEEMHYTLEAMPVDTAKSHAAGVTERFQKTIAEMEAHPALYPANAVYKMKALGDEFEASVSKAQASGDVYSAINELKQNIDKQGKIFGKAISPEYADTANQIKGLRFDIKSNLENEHIWGEAAARQAGFNEAQSDMFFHSGKGSEFQKAFMTPGKSRTGAIRYEVSPAKVKTFFAQINDMRGAQKAEALQNFIDSSKGMVDQIEKTYKSAPGRSFDRKAVDTVIQKNYDAAQTAMHQAELQKNLGMLSGGAHNTYLGEGAAAGVAAFHPVLGGALEAFNMARNPGLAIQRLAKIEKMADKTTQMISRSVKAIFKGGVSAGEKRAGLIGSKLAPSDFSDRAASNDKHKDVFASLQELNGNPQMMIDKLQAATESLHDHAPNISQGVQVATTRATQFLASKIPQAAPRLPLGREPVLSKMEINKFERYYSAVEKPVHVLSQVKDCTLTPEAVEALQTVYPKLYEEMGQSLLQEASDFIAKKGVNAIPFKTKMALSLFTGQDMDSAFEQPAIMANQGAMAQSGSAPAQGQNQTSQAVNQGGMNKVNVSSPMLTASQSSAQRREV